MFEQEYINATDVTYVRLATYAIRQTTPEDEERYRTILRLLVDWRLELEASFTIQEE